MRASRTLWVTHKDSPQGAEIASHRLLLRGGFIQQLAPGIYTWLPLGLRVLQKIQTIVREEQDAIGALEMLAPTLQPAELWKESGRYEDYGKEMLRVTDRHERTLVYGPTAEEVVTDLFRVHIQSYRALPCIFYNIQWKFRDEIRPRYGIMRGREFLMKDSYSFDLTPEAAYLSYEKTFNAYLKTFKRMGLKAIPVRANTGPIGGDLSHEFHVVAATGESHLYYDVAVETADLSMKTTELYYTAADEKHNADTCNVPAERLRHARGIEVGHVFYFGTKYSRALNAVVTMSSGKTIPVEMGSYGIGVSRVMGAIVEAHHDERGVCWPESVAPYTVAIAHLQQDFAKDAETVYQSLTSGGVDCLWYDLEHSPGTIFADLDLIGIPYHVFLGKSWKTSGTLEVKVRKTGERHDVSPEELLGFLRLKGQGAHV